MKFLKCDICGNIVGFVEDNGVPPYCCGVEMEELVAGVSDGAHEKHVPVATVEGNTVSVVVGEVEHPMIASHYISWIALETKEGNQRKVISDVPKCSFTITDGDEACAVYAYCNLHGLWKTTL